MAVTGPSNDYGYQPTTYQLIQGAARLISAIQTGETLEDQEYSDALFSLNGMIAAWQAMGIHVWSEVFGTLFLAFALYLRVRPSGEPLPKRLAWVPKRLATNKVS